MNDKDHKIETPEKVKRILDTLQNAGHEAYIVGGCVRDCLIGRTPGDWDITTSALPLEVKSLFRNTVDTGLQHGTVTVVMDREGFEVTTYRKDGKYSDNRRPDEVEFTPSLEEDLKRRDFTINALAYNEMQGIVDLFDGMGDLRRGIIRCVGDADQRFSEDALRIMRAVRFAAQLSFEIEPGTYQAIKNHAVNLQNVSMERIRVEFEKTLMSDHPEYVNRYAELGLAEYIILKDAQDKEDKKAVSQKASLAETDTAPWTHCFLPESVPLYEQLIKEVKALDAAGGKAPDAHGQKCLRLAAFFKELPLRETDVAIRALKYDNRTKVTVISLLQYKDDVIPPDKRMVKRALYKMGPELLRLVWIYKTAQTKAGNALQFGEMRCFEMRDEMMLEDAKELTEEILESGEPYKLSMLDINGDDIIAEGVKEGEKIGRILEELLQLVIDDPAFNRKEVLLEKVKKLQEK